jgi:hypothetical protein
MAFSSSTGARLRLLMTSEGTPYLEQSLILSLPYSPTALFTVSRTMPQYLAGSTLT